ncbi:hypothetical protein RJ640_001134 [Escallonia rubra]|uniref:FAF domain-containing protein n=1 Tax=Escallonia rubra TaxID=112253 RepID=A0AA88U8W9_9ASTE|nr:hypothetical protein RJ640_001134 [Escallonia rubra]
MEAEVLGQRCGADVKTRRQWWGKRSEKGKKEYPPAIPWLARTENLSSAHMPWVFRRHYTADGRLVITEEKVERHEYFRAHRSDGKLTLQLVPFAGDGVLGDHQEMEEDGGGGELDGGDGWRQSTKALHAMIKLNNTVAMKVKLMGQQTIHLGKNLMQLAERASVGPAIVRN